MANADMNPENPDDSFENKLDLYEKQSDDLEPDDNPGDYGKKRKMNFDKFFKPSEIKITAGDDAQLNASLKKEPIYLKRYRINEPLQEHSKFMQSVVATDPSELVDMHLYIQGSKDREIWYRIYIKLFNKTTKKYEVEYQNQSKTIKRLKLLHEMIIIDQQQFTTKPNCQQLTFNNKKRVFKLLQKELNAKREKHGHAPLTSLMYEVKKGGSSKDSEQLEEQGQSRKRRKLEKGGNEDDESSNNILQSKLKNLKSSE